jgi:hypothetical protein
MTQLPSSRLPSEKPPAEGGTTGNSRTYPSEDLIQHTIRVWEPRLGRTLTEEDARQILENVVGFFRVLHDWNRKEHQAGAELNDMNDRSR